MNDWPKKEIYWNDDNILYISIPFTWRLPIVKAKLKQRELFQSWKSVVVGGPAAYLMPDYFEDLGFVSIGKSANGIMQKINPMATKTSVGCVRKCEFCAVPKIEGNIKELSDWPDLPIITDNNLLACSKKHFNRVIDRLKKHKEVDFNQGIDARLLKKYHADRFSELKKPIVRLALDNLDYSDSWMKAYQLLRNAGLPKNLIRSYAIIGFNSGPGEAWERCEFINKLNIKVLPMWYHSLNQTKQNIVTDEQKKIGMDRP